MTRIMLMSTAAFLFGGVGAIADDAEKQDKANATVTAPKSDDLDDFGKATVLGKPGDTITYSQYGGRYIRGSKILGAQIDGATDLSARIDDVVLSDAGAIDSVIVTAGGFFGAVGDDAVVATKHVTLFRDADGLRVSTPLTQDQLEARADQRAGRDVKARPADDPTLAGWSLAALLGAAVDTADTENTAQIEEVLFNNDGAAAYVVARTGGVTGLNGAIGLGGDLHVVRYADLKVAMHENELDVDLAMSSSELVDRARVVFSES